MKITVKARYGEYLSGYAPATIEAQEILESLGLAEYVSDWGWYVNPKIIEALGEEFTREQAEEYARPMMEAKAQREQREKERQAAELAEVQKAFTEELFVRRDGFFPICTLLHSMGAVVSENENEISVFTRSDAKVIPGANTTYTIRNVLKAAGFRWNPQRSQWMTPYSPEMAEKAVDILRKYDSKANPDGINLVQCWECGRWHAPSESVDASGYCGC